MFEPVTVDTSRALELRATDFFRKIRITVTRLVTYPIIGVLVQRMSLAVLCGNAIALIRTGHSYEPKLF